LGKISVGVLKLALFNEVQEQLLLKKLFKLELAVEHAKYKNTPDLSYRFIDLQLYRTQIKRILDCTLYFLKITTDRETFYKVGVTQRPIAARIKEVKIDLVANHKMINIEVLGTWTNRGNIEKYFKHRYQNFNYPIGSLTEYYKFSNIEAENVLHDLQQMKVKELSQPELNGTKIS
jgi:K+ transporter